MGRWLRLLLLKLLSLSALRFRFPAVLKKPSWRTTHNSRPLSPHLPCLFESIDRLLWHFPFVAQRPNNGKLHVSLVDGRSNELFNLDTNEQRRPSLRRCGSSFPVPGKGGVLPSRLTGQAPLTGGRTHSPGASSPSPQIDRVPAGAAALALSWQKKGSERAKRRTQVWARQDKCCGGGNKTIEECGIKRRQTLAKCIYNVGRDPEACIDFLSFVFLPISFFPCAHAFTVVRTCIPPKRLAEKASLRITRAFTGS